MIINSKENNKNGQHQHIPNEHPVRLSPPSEGLGEALVSSSLLQVTFQPMSYPFVFYELRRI